MSDYSSSAREPGYTRAALAAAARAVSRRSMQLSRRLMFGARTKTEGPKGRRFPQPGKSGMDQAPLTSFSIREKSTSFLAGQERPW